MPKPLEVEEVKAQEGDPSKPAQDDKVKDDNKAVAAESGGSDPGTSDTGKVDKRI